MGEPFTTLLVTRVDRNGEITRLCVCVGLLWRAVVVIDGVSREMEADSDTEAAFWVRCREGWEVLLRGGRPGPLHGRGRRTVSRVRRRERWDPFLHGGRLGGRLHLEWFGGPIGGGLYLLGAAEVEMAALSAQRARVV